MPEIKRSSGIYYKYLIQAKNVFLKTDSIYLIYWWICGTFFISAEK